MDSHSLTHGDSVTQQRLVRITAANLRHKHLYVRDLRDILPADIFGPPKRANGSRGIEIVLDGLNETITTDIGRDAKTGKPRGFLRDRSSIGRFFEYHQVTEGTSVAFQRLGDRKYRLSVADTSVGNTLRGVPRGTGVSPVPVTCATGVSPVPSAPDTPPAKKPRAAEFFAGIGLVRLALERQGWDVVFANDIDEDKAKMYRDNWPGDNHLVVGDIHNLKPDDIPDCELFTASFPS